MVEGLKEALQYITGLKEKSMEPKKKMFCSLAILKKPMEKTIKRMKPL